MLFWMGKETIEWGNDKCYTYTVCTDSKKITVITLTILEGKLIGFKFPREFNQYTFVYILEFSYASFSSFLLLCPLDGMEK